MLTTAPRTAPWSSLAHLPREARDTLFLLVVLAWVLLPQLGNLPLWCSTMAISTLLWRAWLALGSRALPRRWMLLGLLVLAMVGTWTSHRTLLGREAGVSLVVALLALKTLELRARRDAFVVFFLGFFTMLTNFLQSQSLLTAASMLIGLLGLLTALVNAHMPVGRPPLSQAARTAARMALLGAPIMAALFVLFPRVAPLWGTPGDGGSARSGLSNSMRVGSVAELALDDTIAMRILFEGEPPPNRELYFRGPVMAGFDGREWKPLQSWQRSAYRADAQLQTQGAPVRYTVTQEMSQRPWFTPLEATPELGPITGYNLMRSADLQWLTDRPVADIVRYTVTSYPSFRHGPQRTEPQLATYTDLPPGYNPRTLAWAAELRADPQYASANGAAWVALALERLRSGGYAYTLDPGVYGRHSADEFWFERKEGFCEHIASSFVILMRALGVPARIVTGYQGGERNPVDNYWVVRQSDAHAWAEVWQTGQGWVRVDPTGAVSPGRVGSLTRLQAPRGVVATALGVLGPDMLGMLRSTWDAVNNRWNQWVLNYSKGRQLDLLKDLGFESPDWEELGYLIAGLLALLSLGASALTLWERRQHDPWLRLLERTRARLEKSGLEISGHVPPREIARQVQAVYGARGEALHAWLLQMERWRYAPRASGQAARRELQQLQKSWGALSWPTP